ncbi:MAG: molybdopterin cofactor-binding domain-containing protein [Blastocatellia bacterium]
MRDERSPLSGLTEKDLAVEQGRVFARNNPPRGETYEQIFKRMNQRLVEVRAGAQPGRERGSEATSGQQQQRGNEQNRAAQASASQDGVYSFHSFGAQFCEVRVDESLGIVRIARFLGAYGAGRILNMKTAISQMQSGITWGISMALHEATLLDKAHGYFVNADLAEYHVPVNLDIPNIEVHFIEEKDEIVDPVGAKGIGEIGIVGVAAAVANAVYHATGKRVRDLPITIDKLL